jgi:hypothetical protein
MKLPSIATTILSAALTAVAVLNVTTFHFGEPWLAGLAVMLPALAAFGIAPITGAAFQAIIDLTPAETTLAASILSVGEIVVLKVNLETGWKAALTGVVAVAAALGFGPNTVVAVKTMRQVRRERFAPASQEASREWKSPTDALKDPAK